MTHLVHPTLPIVLFWSTALANGLPTQAGTQRSAQSTTGSFAHLHKAQDAIEKRQPDEARKELVLALQADPRSAPALVMLGNLDYQEGRAAAAIDHYQRALKFEPRSFTAHYSLALAYLREGKLADGVEELRKAVSLNPRSADANYNLGLVLMDASKPEDALRCLRQARAVGTDRPDVAFNIVRSELMTHRPQEARQEADQAAQKFGNDPDWRAAVGRLFIENGAPEDAIVYLREALSLRPKAQEISRELAAAYLQGHQPEAVLDLIKEPGGAEDHYLRASAYVLIRRLADADRECRRALDLAPSDPRFLLVAARIRQRLGKQEEALDFLRQAAEVAPRWAQIPYSAAVSYYFERRYAESRRSLDEALNLDPKWSKALFLYGVTLVNEGHNHDAELYFRRAIAVEPWNARFHLHLGTALLRNNQRGEARRAFEDALGLNSHYGLAHYELGKVRLQANELKSAREELEAAVRDQPDLAQAYYQLSRVCAALGMEEESSRARLEFDRFKQEQDAEEAPATEDVKRELDGP